ncbi:DNA-directed RNA polymerase subunit beta' [Natranaerobius thermophilus]|uniref:DNA-directed RNA polymerase subunit beta' n=1 Tax=Natranaerobius thermophilus (strain ATCC BAA-1301 / DSM 18059 / JW/NM-WN-LF) TaxID=457570 RepID=RPOC_NATTJ|nr:DNA-directed RNA polymerase subunit beta' [Natranaerobius thermophilus]B2A4D2.1 RecName: Full=DNA-directed RNA polymerase subunit beta'; Short=RNAP subunit beta'; AltName: Full=RNA polymerase subunit beta'; AltName: Full=Transcriptase subunit beta' [Natranaerobius thermophilus JW/NM-WN-LF]ACB83786.1 DNA-directed RNA polymerase, beta' subunit [Natranaerobius thermophilus JW/NM-WN-LF]
MIDVNSFNALKIGLASPEQIRSWSKGEVKKPETINYRTLKPEKEGLFCEKIFGPQKDWECHCGKYKRVRYKGIVCDRCGVEVTQSKVRRERMGHIELAAPVSHIWYFKGIPSRLGLLLNMSPRALEKVLYFASYVVIDPGETSLAKKQLLTETEYREYYDKFESQFKKGKGFKAMMGAEAIKELLKELDLEALTKELRNDLKTAKGQKKVRTVRRLEVAESFRKSGNKPEWMILDVIPVIPPDLRPMVQLDGGRFATSDLNDLYRRVINRNNRLKRLLNLGAPDIIVRNEKRMLQEAVDALIDNGRRGRAVTGPGNRPLKSLSDMLKGKQGRFRQNLLGKRVDYSGRSVIVVGPELKIYQCGLPKEMALELFKPFVMKRLVEKELSHNIKSAKRMVEKVRPEVWDVLEEVIKEHPVLLNRAPTLHRLGIQAFEPVLIEGRAIQIHPLVCPAYNADFDGDQMAVHLPLSAEAQAEARILMLASQNILNPKDGSPVATPTQDMVLGSYYLTLENTSDFKNDAYFSSPAEAVMAFRQKDIDMQEPIAVDVRNYEKKDFSLPENNKPSDSNLLITTVGKIIFNEIFPEDFPYVNGEKPGLNEYDWLKSGERIEDKLKQREPREAIQKGSLGDLVGHCYRKYGSTKTASILDKMKEVGYSYATKAGVTIGITDVAVPEKKHEIISDAEGKVDEVEKQHHRGLITPQERYTRVIDIWNNAKDSVTGAVMDNLDIFNPIYMMATSGARGNISQITQLAGMRGLMADPTGRIIDLPIKTNFREGLTVLEYFNSTHGARKGLADTALKTADSGYLTRRLVDVSQDVIVREEDCGETDGVEVGAITNGNEIIEGIGDRVVGRFAAADIRDRQGNMIVNRNELITEDAAEQIQEAKLDQVPIRSVLTCKTKNGVCVKCYGRDLATGAVANVGEAVGIIAAQSIGEPGTQLTMRTFHTGGVAGDDITQGLPRIEELFEARKPKGLAVISEIDGRITVKTEHNKRKVIVTPEKGEQKSYNIPYGARLKVKDGDEINAGDEITEGSINPHDLLKIKGVRGVQLYILQEVQKVYRMQGVDISDKHIEIIIRQMLKKVRIEEAGDTELLPGSYVDFFDFEKVNERIKEEGGEPAKAKSLLLGITKASLATDSFLSAASFQETTRVLTEAAIKGKVDPLIGLKENVIIGKLVPAGTGMPHYRNIDLAYNDEENEAQSDKSQDEQEIGEITVDMGE